MVSDLASTKDDQDSTEVQADLSLLSGVQHGYHASVCMPGCKPNHGL